MWKNFSATAQGPWYYEKGKNNQDAVDNFVDDKMAISFICDGCGGSANTEVIARLSVSFLVRTAKQLLIDGVALDDLPDRLFAEYLEYLKWKVDTEFLQTSEQVESFIRDYLLCTINGVIVFDEKILFLICGDGSTYLDNSIYQVFVSPGNRPTYAAYCLYKHYGFVSADTKVLRDEKGRETVIPVGFETKMISATNIKLVGISSDGLNDLPSLFDELRLYATSQLSLNLCMNRIAIVRGETKDNVTVSFLIRI